MTGRPVVISYNSCRYVYTFRMPLIRALRGEGWPIVVVAPRDEYTDRVAGDGIAFREIALEPRGRNPVRELATLRAYRTIYAELDPAIVLQYTIKPNIYGSIAARRLGIPVVNNVTGLGTMFSGGPLQAFGQFLYRRAFRSAELVFFQNPDDQKLFIDAGMVDSRRCALLPGSGVDPLHFAPRPRLEGPFTFLYLGRLLRAKGAEAFIEAARTLQGRRSGQLFRCVLLGTHNPSDPDMIEAHTLERAIADGIVEHPGTTDDVRPTIAAADCVVLPSWYREGVPRSLLEAASMGKILVAADSVGTREPVEDGKNGFLCRPRDTSDLCRAMEAVLDLAPAKRKRMEAESRRIALERFDERIVIDRYLDAVRRLARGEPRTARRTSEVSAERGATRG